MTVEKKTIVPDEYGVYRWRYDLNLLTNPGIYFLVWRIFFAIITVGFGFVMIFDAINWNDFFFDRCVNDLKFYGVFMIGMTAVSLLGYLVYAASMGGKYCVEFEMDEKGILHKQVPSQADKARKLSRATMAAGFMSGRMSTVGVGANAGRTEIYSDFSKVRKIKAYPKRGLIKVNGLFSHNQVYVSKECFETVLSYIRSRCKGVQ